MTDSETWANFLRTGSPDAFAQLVRQHIDTVYSAARRQVRDPQLAEDVTQAVFIILLKKSRTIRPDVPLIAWLLKTTYFASRDALKSEARRRRHEQQAAAMKNSIANPIDIDISLDLDRALARLADMDRGIIGLRYLEDKTIEEIAGTLSISRDAAAKRLTRAVGKLRRILQRHQNISAAISTEAVLAGLPRLMAPAHLGNAAIAAATSSSLSTSTIIAKGAIKMMFWSQAKVAVILLAGAVVGALAISAHSLVRAASATPAAQAATTSHRCIGQFSNGPSIEILGIAEHDDATGQPIQWWAVDGSPLDFGPYAQMGKVSLNPQRPTDIEREVAIRVNDDVTGSAEKASVQWYFVGSGASAGNLPEDDHGRTVANVDALLLTLPDNPNGATLHFGVATGPWKTHLITPPGSTSSMTEGDNSLLTSEGFEVQGQTHIIVTVASTKALTDQAERLIAVTTLGKTIQAYVAGESATGNAMMMEMIVPAPLRSIKELRYQTRPWNQWLDIRHISLHADHATQVQIISSDDLAAPAK